MNNFEITLTSQDLPPLEKDDLFPTSTATDGVVFFTVDNMGESVINISSQGVIIRLPNEDARTLILAGIAAMHDAGLLDSDRA